MVENENKIKLIEVGKFYFVHNRPMMCKRKDIGSKELVGMRFHEDDMDLINKISNRNPEYTPTFNK